MSVVLPWPPSVNRIWRHVVIGGTGRTIMSKEGREYRARVAAELSGAFRGRPPRFIGPVGVMIRAYPPDERRRDLDNVLKAALDALSAAGVWDDDHRVADLRIVRYAAIRGGGGKLDVTVTRLAARAPARVGCSAGLERCYTERQDETSELRTQPPLDER